MGNEVCTAIASNTTDYKEVLQNTRRSIAPSRLQKGCAALANNTNITAVSLTGNAFGPQSLQYIAEALKVNYTLTHLYLGWNSFDAVDLPSLGRALRRNVGIVVLDLSGNNFGAAATIQFCHEVWPDRQQGNEALQALGWARNEAGITGVQALLGARSKLTALAVGYNGLTAQDTPELLARLRSNNTITVVALHGIEPSDAMMASVRTIVSVHPTLQQVVFADGSLLAAHETDVGVDGWKALSWSSGLLPIKREPAANGSAGTTTPPLPAHPHPQEDAASVPQSPPQRWSLEGPEISVDSPKENTADEYAEEESSPGITSSWDHRHPPSSPHPTNAHGYASKRSGSTSEDDEEGKWDGKQSLISNDLKSNITTTSEPKDEDFDEGSPPAHMELFGTLKTSVIRANGLRDEGGHLSEAYVKLVCNQQTYRTLADLGGRGDPSWNAQFTLYVATAFSAASGVYECVDAISVEVIGRDVSGRESRGSAIVPLIDLVQSRVVERVVTLKGLSGNLTLGLMALDFGLPAGSSVAGSIEGMHTQRDDASSVSSNASRSHKRDNVQETQIAGRRSPPTNLYQSDDSKFSAKPTSVADVRIGILSRMPASQGRHPGYSSSLNDAQRIADVVQEFESLCTLAILRELTQPRSRKIRRRSPHSPSHSGAQLLDTVEAVEDAVQATLSEAMRLGILV